VVIIENFDSSGGSSSTYSATVFVQLVEKEDKDFSICQLGFLLPHN